MRHHHRLLLGICLAALSGAVLSVHAAGVRVRVMAANTTTGNYQSYQDPGRRIFQGLDPDVVLIQEFNVGDNSTAATDAFVADAFGPGFVWFREPGDEQIPNGIVSRWPILAAGQWSDGRVSNRDFAWARIDLPGDIDLWAVSVHFLTSSAGDRAAEAQALVSYISAAVPSGDYLVVGGDLNTSSRTETAVQVLASVTVTGGPYPADRTGNANTNLSRSDPYDWVLANGVFQGRAVSATVGSRVYPYGLVFDSRVFTPLSEVAPILYGDSTAPNMQHMAVVRDFLVPTEGDDFALSRETVDFGVVDAGAGPFTDDSIHVTVVEPFSVTAVTLTGADPGEFAVGSPDPGALPALFTADADLVFRWSPPGNDGRVRSAEAVFATDGNPDSFSVTLSGTTSGSSTGNPVDLDGWGVVQSNGAVTFTVPAGVSLPPGGVLVIGRDADRAAFESFWGPMPAAVVYLDGFATIGGNGFPVINGDEVYRLLDAGGTAVDPPTGDLPAGGMTSSDSVTRISTSGTAFSSRSSSSATPGVFEGEAAGTGTVVIGEISDASGSGNYVYEFIELFYDAAESSPALTAGLSLF